MKKVFSFLLIMCLGCFVVGCKGDPGVSVEEAPPATEPDENMEAAGAADGLEEESGDAPPD